MSIHRICPSLWPGQPADQSSGTRFLCVVAGAVGGSVVVRAAPLYLEGDDGDYPHGGEHAVGDDVGADLLRDGEAQEDVAHGQQDRRAPDVVVVPVPEPPRLGRLVRPRQDRQHLWCGSQSTKQKHGQSTASLE
jgi:hypothetical protein